MKGKVINFNKARIIAYMRRYEKTGVLHKNLYRVASSGLPPFAREFKSYPYAAAELKNYKIRIRKSKYLDFENDLEVLKNNFKTESSKFMFPTVMSNYRRGMNPVRALYYELQKTLFQFDKNNHVHVWILSLFKDIDWYNSLIDALEADCRAITKFQLKHLPVATVRKGPGREISVLNNVKENLKHFKEVFILMKESEDRYLK